MVIHNFPESVILTADNAHRWKVRNVRSGDTMNFPLWEDPSGIIFNEIPVIPSIHYVYIPKDDAPVCRKITVADGFLRRSMTETPEWHPCSSITVMEFTSPGQWYETISLHPDAGSQCPLIWHRYLSTDDPDAEQPADCTVRTNRLVSECEVVGFEHYCEKVHIPAAVNGREVRRVDLSRGYFSNYLREFVAEKGIPLISMDFDVETLERIEAGEDAVLSEPPNGILNTAWFHRQEGDVYFGGYYCGTRGKASEPVLHLKEGTVGILAHAQGGEGRENVILPDSLRYIGPRALKDVPGFQRQNCFPSVPMTDEPSGLLGNAVNPENLYQLGRCGFTAGHLIPAGYEPVSPWLTYENGWIAHYFYSNEFTHHIQYYLAVHLPSGMPVQFEKLDSAADARTVFWRRDRLTAHYFWAEDYLTRASALVRKGPPSLQDLKSLETRWYAVIPLNLRSEIGYFLKHISAKEAATTASLRKRGTGS